MALEELEQQGRGMAVGVFTLAAIWLYLDVKWLLEASAMNPDDLRIRQSAWIVLLLWPIAAACLQLHRWNRARYSESRLWVKTLYTTSLVMMILHIVVA